MSRSALSTALAATAVIACALAPLARRNPRDESATRTSLGFRLLGPLASLAASAEWIRADMELRAGRSDLALRRAERALAIDPGATAGWSFLAWHLAFDRGSPEREPDARRRVAWIRAALDVTARGERAARSPSELALLTGFILAFRAAPDPELDWPGGKAALLREAEQAFRRAADLGQASGHDLAEEAARIAQEVDRGR